MFDMLRVTVILAGEDETKEDEEHSLSRVETLLKEILHKMEGLSIPCL